MPFDWKKLFSVATQLPAVRRVMSLTIAELEENPSFVAFVERYQKLDPNQQCTICLVHKYAKSQNLTNWEKAPEHSCADNQFQKNR